MIRNLLLSAVVALSLATVSQASPMIVVGTHPVPIASSVLIDVFVTGVGTGVDAIGSIDLVVSLASESPVAPPGEPKINNIDVVTGTIFAGNSANPAPGQVTYGSVGSGFPDDQQWTVSNITVSGVITNSGKLFTIDINTLGIGSGIWALRVLGAGFGPSVYSNALVLGVPFQGADGSIWTPEPGSFVLAGFAALAFGVVAVRRRRRTARATASV